VLVRAPVRSGTARPESSVNGKTSPIGRRNLYWRLRAALYTHIPGLVRFYDLDALQQLIEEQGFTVVRRTSSGTSVTILAYA
jgi:hypothetical protein